MTTPRIIIWAAVSSKPQANEDKSSLEVQENEGRAYAERVGGEVIDVLRVPGHSRDLWRWEDAEESMPAYRKLREHCEAADFDLLFAWDTDRLGRDAALSQQVLSLVKRSGASIYIHAGGYTVGEKSESASYMYSIDSVRAAQDQIKRKKRHRFGMINRIKRGLHPGTWPYGYKPIRDAAGNVVGGEGVPDELEAVRYITRLYLGGLGYRAICHKLEERGYAAPGNGQWWANSVREILDRDMYAGYLEWGGVKTDEPSDKFPHVWDKETYRAIIRERHRRAEMVGGDEIATIYTGVAMCRRCGAPMQSSPTTSRGVRYHYYRCQTHAERNRQCHPNFVRLEYLEAAFDDWLANLRSVGLDAVVRDTMPEEAERLERERVNLEAAQTDAEAQLDRLAAAVASGTIQASTASRTEANIFERITSYDERIDEIDQQLAALPNAEEQRVYLEMVLDSLSSAEGDRKFTLNRALRNLGIRILCEDGEVVEITY